MMMNFCRSQRHCPPNVVHLNPRAVEISRTIQLGQDTRGALLHHLRNEFVRVQQCATNGGEQSAWSSTTRIVAHIGDKQTSVAGQFAIHSFSDVLKGSWWLGHKVEFY